VYRNGFEIRADPYFRSDMDLVVRRIKTEFPTEAERQAQVVQERLAELERERKLAEDRQRLADMEAEEQRKQESARLALIRDEEERKRREEAAVREKAETNFKEKQDILGNQRNGLVGGIAFLAVAIGIALGGFIGHSVWSNAMHQLGGTVLAVVIIGSIAIVGGFVGFGCGGLFGLGITGNTAAAITTIVGTLAGGVFGVVRGAGTNGGITSLVIGGGLGLMIGAIVFGIVGAIMRNEYASPWYVKGPQRIFIPEVERVKPTAPKKN
jgi:hypothetical protein